MINIFRRLLVLVAVCFIAFPAPTAPRAEHVFIISIDGGNPTVMQPSEMPVFKKLVKQGAHTWLAETIRPSLTLTQHF